VLSHDRSTSTYNENNADNKHADGSVLCVIGRLVDNYSTQNEQNNAEGDYESHAFCTANRRGASSKNKHSYTDGHKNDGHSIDTLVATSYIAVNGEVLGVLSYHTGKNNQNRSKYE
jgi:hypothetical protein